MTKTLLDGVRAADQCSCRALVLASLLVLYISGLVAEPMDFSLVVLIECRVSISRVKTLGMPFIGCACQ